MEKLIARMMESGTRLAFALLLVFCAISAFTNIWLALGELAVVVVPNGGGPIFAGQWKRCCSRWMTHRKTP